MRKKHEEGNTRKGPCKLFSPKEYLQRSVCREHLNIFTLLRNSRSRPALLTLLHKLALTTFRKISKAFPIYMPANVNTPAIRLLSGFFYFRSHPRLLSAGRTAFTRLCRLSFMSLENCISLMPLPISLRAEDTSLMHMSCPSIPSNHPRSKKPTLSTDLQQLKSTPPSWHTRIAADYSDDPEVCFWLGSRRFSQRAPLSSGAEGGRLQ